ncbi:MAG: hypothetical protein NT171_04755 [Planctomycetota bacterium]|nr:hypothetical protein [Planctomycetota bacterium]
MPRPRFLAPLALSILLAVTAPAAAVDLTGSWTGSWESRSTGHAGPLRATFRPCGEDRWTVDFSGRFFKLLPFKYSVTLRVVEDAGDRVTLAGTSWLGRLFGTFCYRADATACRFEARYTSKKDTGIFRLERAD